jgi:hypothetical protein
MDHLHQQSKVDIRPEANFTAGLEIETHSRLGSEYDTEVAHMSSQNKSAAAVFGLRFTLTDPNVGPAAVESLNQILEMGNSVDQLRQAREEGAEISFRHEGNYLYINVEVTGQSAEKLHALPLWDKFDLSKTVFSGRSDVKISSGFDPTRLLTGQVEDFAGMLSNFRVEGQANFEELHHVLDAVHHLVEPYLKSVGVSEKHLNMGWNAVNLLRAFVSFGLEFRYDANVIKNVVLELLGVSGVGEQSSTVVNQYQGQSNEYVEMAKQMAPMFLGPFLETLRGVNLGSYHFWVMVPRARIHYDFGISFPTLNSWLNSQFLSP